MEDLGKSDTLVGGYQAPASPGPRRSVSSVVYKATPSTSIPTRSIRKLRRSKDELDKCVFLEFDAEKKRWVDRLRQPRHDLPKRVLSSAPPTAGDGTAQASVTRHLVMGLLLMVLPPVGVLMTWASADIPVLGKKSVTWLGAFVLFLQVFVVLTVVLARR